MVYVYGIYILGFLTKQGVEDFIYRTAVHKLFTTDIQGYKGCFSTWTANVPHQLQLLTYLQFLTPEESFFLGSQEVSVSSNQQELKVPCLFLVFPVILTSTDIDPLHS